MLNELLQLQHHGADVRQFAHRFVMRMHGCPKVAAIFSSTWLAALSIPRRANRVSPRASWPTFPVVAGKTPNADASR